MENEKIYTYISHQKNEYPVRIIASYDYHVDVELIDEDTTMLRVLEYKIKEIKSFDSDLEEVIYGQD